MVCNFMVLVDAAAFAFQNFGVINILATENIDETLPQFLTPIGLFLSKLYAPKNSKTTTIPNLLWGLYCLKDFEKKTTSDPSFQHHIKTQEILSLTTVSSKSFVTGAPTCLPEILTLCYFHLFSSMNTQVRSKNLFSLLVKSASDF